MKLWVTGATGFVGAWFVRVALSRGHEVIALRRSGSRPGIALSDQPSWIEGDLRTCSTFGSDAFEGVDAFVHLASHSANYPYDSLESCLRHNVNETLDAVRAARNAGVSRFVICGSNAEYGAAGARYEFIPPDAPLEPTNAYAASKAAASVALRAFAVETRARLSIHRLFQIFGEGELESRLWPSLRRAALAGEDLEMTPGEQVRDFLPVEEVAVRLVDAAERSDIEAGEPLFENVGSGRPQSIREFAQFWWEQWRAKGELKLGALPYRPGEVMRYVPQVGTTVEARVR